MKKYQLVSLLWLVSSVFGQNMVDLRTQSKDVDFSGAASTKPAKSGTSLPATCNPGEMFFNTGNSPGQNLYGCEPANTWTLLSGSTNGTVSTASSGQFAYYSAAGDTLVGHTLAASDIPALSYQSLLTFTGTGAKTASSTGTLMNNDCAKWDANGNVIDAGSPCATVATGSPGQFGYYSAAGTTLSPHTLAASDIPALNYQAPLSFTGSGAKTASSTGTVAASDCAKWDVNGNIIDAGVACANVASGAAGQFAYYASSGAALIAHSLAATDIPALNYQAPLSFTGTGTKTISSTGAGVANNCAKWDSNGNVVDAGSPCGSGSGGSSLITPSSTTVGNIPEYSNNTGSSLSAGLGLVTTVGSPGLDSNVPSEKAIRTAIAAAASVGELPASTGSAGYLMTNGTSPSWGDLVTGPSGALCAGTGCPGGTAGIVDIVTAVVPRLAAANTFTGVNKFQQLQVTVYTVATLPACNSSFEGQMEGVSDAASPSYLAAVTGGGSTHVPVYCNGTAWVAH